MSFTNLDTYRRVVCDVALIMQSPHYESDTEKAFAITDTVVRSHEHSISTNVTIFWLVEVAKRNDRVKQFHALSQKISAIKVIREISGCGLKDAKDAYEVAFPVNADIQALREKLTYEDDPNKVQF